MKFDAELAVCRAAVLRRRKEEEVDPFASTFLRENISAFCVCVARRSGTDGDNYGGKNDNEISHSSIWTGSEDGSIVRWQSSQISSPLSRQNVKSVLMQEKIQPTHLLRGHDGAEVVLMFRNSLRFVTSISRDGSVCIWNASNMQCEEKRHVIESSTTTRILDCVLLKMKGGLEVVIVATLDVGVTAYDAKTMKRIAEVCNTFTNDNTDALVMSLKLGAPEGVQCDEILATFDDGEVKLVNVKEEIERQHQQLAKRQLVKEKVITAASSSSSAATTKTTEEDADADVKQNNTSQTMFAAYTGFGGGKRRRFQNMPSTSTNASKHGALKICDDSVVSSQTYLIAERHTKKMMQSKGEDTSNICSSSSSSSSSSSNHDVGFSLVAFGFANGVIEVHSMEDGKNDYDKEDAYSSLNNRHYSHKGAVRCLAQVKSPFRKNSDINTDELLLFASGGDDGMTKLWKVEERKGQRSVELVAQSQHHIAPTVAILPLTGGNISNNSTRKQKEKVVQFMTISENGDVGILGVVAEEEGLVYHTEDDNNNNSNLNRFRIVECKLFSRFEPDDDLCHSKLMRGVCEIILDEKMHLLRILYASGSVKMWDTIGDEVLERELYSSSSSMEMWKQSRPAGPPDLRFAGGGKFWRVHGSASSSKVESPNVSSWFREDVVPLASPCAPFLMSLVHLGKVVVNGAAHRSSDVVTSALSVASRATNGWQKRNLMFSKVRVGCNNDATTVVLLDDDKDDEASYDDFMESAIAQSAVEAASCASKKNSAPHTKMNSVIESVGIQDLTEMQARQLFFRCVSLWSSETPCIRAAARNIAKAVLHKAGISEALLLPAPPEADEDERDNEEGGDFFDRAAAKNGDNEASGEKIASFWHAFFMRKEDEAILSSSRTKMQKGVFGLFVCAVGLLSSDDTTSNTRITDAWKGAAISHLLKFVAHTGDDDSTHVHSLASCILRCVIYGEEEEEDEEEEEEDNNFVNTTGLNNNWFSCVRDPNRCLEDAFKSSSFEVLTALASASPSFYVAHVMKRFREIPADSPLHATSIDALTEAVLQSSTKRRTFEPHVVAIAEMLSLCVSSNVSSGGGIQMPEISLAVQLSPTSAQPSPGLSRLRKTYKRSVISLALILAKRCRNVAFHEPTKRLAVGLHGAVKGGSLLAIYDLSVGQKWRTLEDDTVDNAAEKFASSAASGVSGVVEALAKETFGLGIGDLQRQSPAKSTNKQSSSSFPKSNNVICSSLGAVAFDDEGHQIAAYLHERCFVYVWNVNPSWRHAFARGVVPLGTSQRMPCVPLDDLDNNNAKQKQQQIQNKSSLRWKNSNELRLQHGRLDMVYRIGAD